MSSISNYIDNELLQKIKELAGVYLIEDNGQYNSKLVKIYETETDIIYQLKNSYTKRSIRFNILKEPNDAIVATLVFRSRNPNTVRFFDDFYSVKEKYFISNDDDFINYFKMAKNYLNTRNTSLNTPFVKIDTTTNPEELNEKNLLLKVIDRVDVSETQYIIRFKDDSEILNIDKGTKIKLPFTGDLMFRDIRGKYQFYSQAKARYHFNLTPSRKHYDNQNQINYESNYTRCREADCCV